MYIHVQCTYNKHSSKAWDKDIPARCELRTATPLEHSRGGETPRDEHTIHKGILRAQLLVNYKTTSLVDTSSSSLFHNIPETIDTRMPNKFEEKAALHNKYTNERPII